MNAPQGVVIALVSGVDDPESLGRVRLRFPWLAEDGAESTWVRIARPMAGDDRGYYYQPEVGDEALVAYEMGDVNHPVVLGFLHNGRDKPPVKSIDPNVRRLRTTAGHQLDFDDRAGRERVRLTTKTGHELELHDVSGSVELKTTGGQKIRMDDVPGRIRLSTTGGTTITMNDVPSSIELSTASGVTVTVTDAGGVSVTAPTGGVSVSSLTADVVASSALSVTAPTISLTAPVMSFNGAMATFSGVVKCSALISDAVASKVYSPGAGNIW